MKSALVLFVAALGSVNSEESFLKATVVSAHMQPEGMESEHAKNFKDGANKAGQNMKDGAGKVAEDTASAAKQMAEHTQDKLSGDGAHPSDTKVMNMGEGAYQSATAVMQATTSSNTDCEDGKWHDCYKKAGDYLDHAPPGHKHSDELANSQEIKSGASPMSCGLGLIVAVGLAVQV